MSNTFHSTNERCGSCWHFQKFHAESKGSCLRNPPTPLPNGTTIRAVVRASEHACGEFKAGNRPEYEKPQPASPAQAARDHRRDLEQTAKIRPVMTSQRSRL